MFSEVFTVVARIKCHPTGTRKANFSFLPSGISSAVLLGSIVCFSAYAIFDSFTYLWALFFSERKVALTRTDDEINANCQY